MTKNKAVRTRPVLQGRGVVATETPCPLCSSAGHLTIGREVPVLRKLADGSDDRLFCLSHGYVSDDEIVS